MPTFNEIDYTGKLYNQFEPEKKLSNLFGLMGSPTTQFSNEFIGSLGNTYGKEVGEFFQKNPQALQVALDKGLLSIGKDASGFQTITDNGFKDQLSTLMKDPTGNTLQSNTGNSLFGWGTNEQGQSTFGGATGIQWAGAGLGTASTLYGMYNANKSMKLARENFEEQKQLQRANYEMQAKAYNNNLRNQQSGRSFTGMSGSAIRTLGKEYNSRKAKDRYYG